MVVLSTANPYKFPRVVLDALGEAAPESDFDAIHQLELLSDIPAPNSLTMLKQQEERFKEVIPAGKIAEIALL